MSRRALSEARQSGRTPAERSAKVQVRRSTPESLSGAIEGSGR